MGKHFKNDFKKRFNLEHTDLTFLSEWVDDSLNDVSESVKQTRVMYEKLPKDSDFAKVLDATLIYLGVAVGALDKASMEMGIANMILFCDNPVKSVDYPDFKPDVENYNVK